MARTRELVGALRAIFAAWSTGERLNFHGEFYRHTLMTPTFTPGWSTTTCCTPSHLRLYQPGPIAVDSLARIVDALAR